MSHEISESPLQTFQLVNKKSRRVVAVNNASMAAGAELVQMPDTGELDQYWTGRVFNEEILVGNAKSFLYVTVQSKTSVPGRTFVRLSKRGTWGQVFQSSSELFD